MTQFLLFCIATVGMTSIILHGNIFAPLRQFFFDWAENLRQRREHRIEKTGKAPRCRSSVEWFNDLINCAQCTGFWSGLFCGLIIVPTESLMDAMTANVSWTALYHAFLLLCCGFGGSFLSPLGINLIDLVFYRKMNAYRLLEEQDLAQREHRAESEDSAGP